MFKFKDWANLFSKLRMRNLLELRSWLSPRKLLEGSSNHECCWEGSVSCTHQSKTSFFKTSCRVSHKGPLKKKRVLKRRTIRLLLAYHCFQMIRISDPTDQKLQTGLRDLRMLLPHQLWALMLCQTNAYKKNAIHLNNSGVYTQ